VMSSEWWISAWMQRCPVLPGVNGRSGYSPHPSGFQ
jgi:hypothetical protein